VHQKNAAALALTAVKNEDQREFAKLVDSFKSQFNEGARVQVRAEGLVKLAKAVGGHS
jgi:large subunit ribosomal protein L7Ae